MSIKKIILNMRSELWVDVSFHFIWRAAPALIAFYFSIFIAQRLSGNEYFIFSSILSIIVVAASFGSGVISQPLLRFAKELPIQSISYIIIRVPFFIGLFGSILAIFYISYFEYDFGNPLLFFLIFVLIYMIVQNEALKSYLNAQTLFKYIHVIDIFRTSTALGISFLAVSSSLSSSEIILFIIAFSYFVTNIIATKKFLKVRQLSVQSYDMSVFIRYGISIAFWMAIANSFLSVERAIIGAHWNINEEVHSYMVYADVSNNLITTICSALFMVVIPKLIIHHQNSNLVLFSKIVIESVFFLTLGCIFYFLITFGFLYYENMPSNFSSVPLTQIAAIIASSYIWQVGILCHKINEFDKKFLILLSGIILAIFIFAVLSFLLIPSFGLISIPLAKFFAGLFYIVLQLSFSFFYRRAFPDR